MIEALRRAVKALDARVGTDIWEGLHAGLRVAQHLTTGRDRLRAATAGLMFGLGRRGPVTLTLTVAGRRVPFTVPDRAAMAVLVEVFVSAHYAHGTATAPAAILDLGGHVGASALFFRLRYPAARIVAVEASPRLVRLLRRNTAGLGIEVLHAAVAPAPGSVTFSEAAESWAGSIGTGTGGAGHAVEVPAVTLDQLLVEYGIDAVKMDVEGAEFAIVDGARRLAAATTYWGEIHALRDDARTGRLLRAFDGFDVDVWAEGDVTLFTALRA